MAYLLGVSRFGSLFFSERVRYTAYKMPGKLHLREKVKIMAAPKIIVMGDVHGAYKALVQCLERSGFDYEKDTLIQLGDIVDGYPDSYECVEELLKIENLIAIKGNHDGWFDLFIKTDYHPKRFVSNLSLDA